MVEFTTHLNEAETTLLQARAGKSISIEQIQIAIGHVEAAKLSTVQAAEKAKTSMKPKKWATLALDKRDLFLEKYDTAMWDFAEILENYQKAFENWKLATISGQGANYDFLELSNMKLKVQAFAGDAHHKF